MVIRQRIDPQSYRQQLHTECILNTCTSPPALTHFAAAEGPPSEQEDIYVAKPLPAEVYHNEIKSNPASGKQHAEMHQGAHGEQQGEEDSNIDLGLTINLTSAFALFHTSSKTCRHSHVAA
ncbi:hypothetical protein ON010_g2265 [Phytophthora cinnamomi]|nr:hypothetical protein ON010_g2265 [Phytophthora cinnamomi]